MPEPVKVLSTDEIAIMRSQIDRLPTPEPCSLENDLLRCIATMEHLTQRNLTLLDIAKAAYVLVDQIHIYTDTARYEECWKVFEMCKAALGDDPYHVSGEG